ncbi:MAG: DUF4006 family protein [Campylobacter sp.]|nr:DUF4006 family protein [Campylobacter sp.]
MELENKKRKLFGIHGLVGLLLLVAVLLSILVVLTFLAIQVQQKVVDEPYTINEKVLEVPMKANMSIIKEVINVEK